jgi:flagellar motor switch protein FliN/FliY
MAPNKSKLAESDPLAETGTDEALDQAIDDLRGVLKAGHDGGLPDLATDFGGDFGIDPDAGGLGGFDGGLDTSFGGDFEGGDAAGNFGANDFGTMTASQGPGGSLNSNLDLIMDIPIDVEIILGSSRMQVSGLMNLTEGSIIPLDRKIGEPVDLVVNGRLIGRGEITVLENDETRFGIRLIEVNGKAKA